MREPARRRVGSGLLRAFALIGGVATVISFLGSLDWRADLLAAFRLHLAAAFGFLTLAFAVGGRPRATLLSALLLGVNAAPLVSLFWPISMAVDTERPPLRLLTYNVEAGNNRQAEIVERIAGSPADLILLLEVTEPLLMAVRERWPAEGSVVAEARTDRFGIALLSRRALGEARIVRLTDDERFPSVVAQIDWGGRHVEVLGIHPPPPVDGTLAEERDDQLAAAGRWVAARESPVILLGDLNVTRFSPVFDALLEGSGLVDSADGFGWQPTWPSRLGPLGIPIDHVLHDATFFATERRRGPALGSDHRSLEATLRWRPRR